jgi:predicted RNase H-like HicB family nuclease
MSKRRDLTAIITRVGGWYVALCPELDIASQGETVQEAREKLIEALEGFFEAVSAAEVERRLSQEFYVTRLSIAGGETSFSIPR